MQSLTISSVNDISTVQFVQLISRPCSAALILVVVGRDKMNFIYVPIQITRTRKHLTAIVALKTSRANNNNNTLGDLKKIDQT